MLIHYCPTTSEFLRLCRANIKVFFIENRMSKLARMSIYGLIGLLKVTLWGINRAINFKPPFISPPSLAPTQFTWTPQFSFVKMHGTLSFMLH